MAPFHRPRLKEVYLGKGRGENDSHRCGRLIREAMSKREFRVGERQEGTGSSVDFEMYKSTCDTLGAWSSASALIGFRSFLSEVREIYGYL